MILRLVKSLGGGPRAALIIGIPIVAFFVTIAFTLAKNENDGSRAEVPPTVDVVVQRSAPSPTPVPSSPTSAPAATPAPDRTNCSEIRGTAYRSDVEANYYRTNCVTAASAAPLNLASAASTGTQNANAVARPAGTGPGPLFGTGDRLVYARLGINAPVNGRTVGTDGVMGNPAGPTDAVWYDFSGLGLGGYPGAGGNAVFAGHVDYRGYGPAVFYQLRNVREGDIIEYYTASGGYFRYQVIWYGDYPPNYDWASMVSGNNVMTLITCNGTFDASTRQYDMRRVVRATLVQ